MQIGICSWSLQPGSPGALSQAVTDVGVRHVQIALDPIRTGEWQIDELTRSLEDKGLSLLSGMMAMTGEDYSTLESIQITGGVRPDEHWDENLDAARANASLAERLGLELVTLHAGFLPHEKSDPVRADMIGRLRELSDIFAGHNIRMGLETGQETAPTLQAALREVDRANVGVNFDPANMILYGMGDPVEALRELASHVFQIHIKDAITTNVPGTWGTEVVVGTGEVDWEGFLNVYKDAELDCDLVIEREAGDQRVQDAATALRFLEGKVIS